MTDTAAPRPTPLRSLWLRRGLVGAALLVVLIILLYFVGLSSPFLRGFVLPRVGKALHATLTAEEVSLSPFSSLTLRGLRIQTSGEIPLLTTPEVRVRYRLRDILSGTLSVDEVTIDSPILQVVPTPDGRDNLQPILDSATTTPPPPPSSKRAPVALNLHSVTLRNATLRHTRATPGGGRQVTELSDLNVTLDQLVAGARGRLQISAGLGSDRTGATGAGSLRATLKGDLDLELDAGSLPRLAKGGIRVAVARAEGEFAPIAGFASALQVDVTPSEIRQLSLRLEQGGKPLGGVLLTGPFDPARLEGGLKLTLQGIDRQSLAAISTLTGLPLDAASLGAETGVEVSAGGTRVRVNGSASVAGLRPARPGTETPILNLSSRFDVTADLPAKTARLDLLDLGANQAAKPLLQGRLTAPMTVSWGGASAAAGEASLELTITGLNLTEWRGLTGDSLSTGLVEGKARLQTQGASTALRMQADLQGTDLSIRSGTNLVAQLGLQVQLAGSASTQGTLQVDSLRINLAKAGQAAAAVEASGGFTRATGAFQSRVNLRLTPERLLGSGPREELQIGVAGEGSISNTVAEVTRLLLLLPSGGRSTNNEVAMKGRFDFTDRLAQQASLSARAGDLDLTWLHQVVMASRPSAPAAPTP
ncbi:MAG TPA: hypothetical protein DCM86_00290, partial [Verrucomicrobiales bacterium]|nr:hypothetical protein [Verrucomicrobiales bacterium]